MGDDLIVGLLFLVLSVVGWALQKAREAGNKQKQSQKPELTLADIFSDASEVEAAGPLGDSDERPFSAEFGDVQRPRAIEVPKDESIARPVTAEEMVAKTPMPSLEAEQSSSPAKKRTLAGIPFDARGVRQGIIFSEVLGKPKSMR